MKKLVGRVRLVKAASLGTAALAAVALHVTPAAAQDTLAEARMRKMEAEIRAMQRVVFPGAEGKVFAPQITGQGTPATTSVGQPATSAVTDLLTRMETLEAQIARLTGQIEQNTNRIAQLEARAGIAATTPPTALVTDPAGTATPSPTPAPTPAPQANLNAMGASTPSKPAAETGPSAARLAAVRTVEKPQTNDPGDDEYSYGYRLWEAKLFPEAQQQLKLFAEKYPKHSRISYGRNLLGRAFLDDGKPREAAQWFLQNYQSDKKGGRAPDSLLYLAVSMKALKDTNRACIALAEFSETFPAEASGRLKGTYDTTRNGLKCS